MLAVAPVGLTTFVACGGAGRQKTPLPPLILVRRELQPIVQLERQEALGRPPRRSQSVKFSHAPPACQPASWSEWRAPGHQRGS